MFSFETQKRIVFLVLDTKYLVQLLSGLITIIQGYLIYFL